MSYPHLEIFVTDSVWATYRYKNQLNTIGVHVRKSVEPGPEEGPEGVLRTDDLRRSIFADASPQKRTASVDA